MPHAFLLLGAEIAKTSKTAFYIGGGALVVWAVVLAAIGVSRPDFPGGNGGARAVMGLSAVLMLTAMATAVLTS